MTAWQRNIAVPRGAGSSKEVWFRRQSGIIQMLNLVYFAQVLFIFKLSSGLYVRDGQIAMWFMFSCYWYKIKIIRRIITVSSISVKINIHDSMASCCTRPPLPLLHSKINTRDLYAMTDTLRKDRDPISNKIIKFSKSITYFRNRKMLFCNLFIYHLPPSVILSVHEDSFWNLSWSGKSALSPF